jgi:hypothetical protein
MVLWFWKLKPLGSKNEPDIVRSDLFDRSKKSVEMLAFIGEPTYILGSGLMDR